MKKSPAAARKKPRAVDIDGLRARLQEAEETLAAIRDGHVEALVVASAAGPRVFTLEGADHRYRRLVETMNEGALLLNPSGLILYSNVAFAEVVGERIERIVGRSLAEMVDAGSLHKFEALLQSARKERVAGEVDLSGPDGAVVPTHVSMSPNDDDGALGVCAIVTNLTAQKRNEEILVSERLARSILDQAAEAIIVCDQVGVVTRASHPARSIAKGESLHHGVASAFPLRPVPGSGNWGHPALRALSGEVTVGVEMVLPVDGRPEMSVLCTAAPLVNERKQILGCVMSLVDITSRKRAEAERAELLDAERAARPSPSARARRRRRATGARTSSSPPSRTSSGRRSTRSSAGLA